MTKNPRYNQSFSWTVEGEAVELNGLAFGTLRETLADAGTFVSVRKWEENGKTIIRRYIEPPADWMAEFRPIRGTRTEYTPLTWDIRSRKPAVYVEGDTKPYVASGRDTNALGIIADCCGLRRLDPSIWRVLAPNAVLHPQMGPCVTMATDGVHVIVWAAPWPGQEWLMAHRTNLLGPVTSTPTAVWEWTKGEHQPRARSARETLAKRRAELLATI